MTVKPKFLLSLQIEPASPIVDYRYFMRGVELCKK